MLLLAAGAAFAIVSSVQYARDEPGGMALPFLDEYPTVVDILIPPFAAFLIGGCLAFVGELLRRGVTLEAKNTNIALFRPLTWSLAARRAP